MNNQEKLPHIDFIEDLAGTFKTNNYLKDCNDIKNTIVDYCKYLNINYNVDIVFLNNQLIQFTQKFENLHNEFLLSIFDFILSNTYVNSVLKKIILDKLLYYFLTNNNESKINEFIFNKDIDTYNYLYHPEYKCKDHYYTRYHHNLVSCDNEHKKNNLSKLNKFYYDLAFYYIFNNYTELDIRNIFILNFFDVLISLQLSLKNKKIICNILFYYYVNNNNKKAILLMFKDKNKYLYNILMNDTVFSKYLSKRIYYLNNKQIIKERKETRKLNKK